MELCDDLLGTVSGSFHALSEFWTARRAAQVSHNTWLNLWGAHQPFRFVDEQLRGPYRRWHHEHTFEEKDGGTLCRDRVEYDMLGGALINWLLVRRDVETIFACRRQRLLEVFASEGKTSSATAVVA
jgi:ligand-binding SRPBCC domain-containing protein